ALTLLFELLTVNVDGLLLRPGSFDLEDLPLFEFPKKRRLRWRRRDKQKADGNVGQMTYGHGGFLAPNWLASKHRFAMLKGKVLRSNTAWRSAMRNRLILPATLAFVGSSLAATLAGGGANFDFLTDSDRKVLQERFVKEIWPLMQRGEKNG